jgi:hypothetical protein
MSISSNLFLAILAMDSYNRGYGAGIQLDAAQTKIGTALLGLQSSSNQNSPEVAAGFFAQSYSWNGTTVISYRGTNADSVANFLTDAWNGYGTSQGNPNNSQAFLAAEFYQAVTGTTNGDPRNGDVTLTGHSLGGGLLVNPAAAH